MYLNFVYYSSLRRLDVGQYAKLHSRGRGVMKLEFGLREIPALPLSGATEWSDSSVTYMRMSQMDKALAVAL